MANRRPDIGEYPRELWTATRGEYVTNLRKMKGQKKGPGCPLMGGSILLVLSLIIWIIL